MSLIRLENITKRFGGEPILEGVGFRVEEGEKIGLVGRNGSGKSTLFRLMTGEVEPDEGSIERMRRARIACLAQLPQLDLAASVHEVVMDSFKHITQLERDLTDLEHEIAEAGGNAPDSLLARYGKLQDQFHLLGGYEFRAKSKRVLTGLGFSEAEFEMPVDALSGGQRTRLLLALVLLEEADLLLLDEPENHLDIGAREWLESFLKDWGKAFVVISHDRRILDSTVSRIVEIEGGALRGFTGNYAAFRENKALVREQQLRAFKRQQEFIEKEERWINRFRYKNTKASQVQSRIKRLEKMERVEAPPPELDGPRLNLGEAVRSGHVVIEAEDAGKAYGDLVLYRGFSLQVRRGERVAIVGPNGSGKTTLLRQLAGKLPDAEGKVHVGHNASLGFYEQHHDSLNRANDVLSEIRTLRPDMTPGEVRSFLGRFLFRGDDVFKSISALSGGELSRVAIAKLVLGDANVLLLDEPTNHLDIAAREALEAALDAFEGTLVLVTHDRTLVDRLADRLVVVQNGEATVHVGNYSDYRRGLESERAAVDTQGPSLDDVMLIRKPKRKANRARGKEQEREARKQRKRLQQLEDDIAAVEEAIEEVERQSVTLAPDEFEKARELKASHEGLQRDLRDMYEEWERLAEEAGVD